MSTPLMQTRTLSCSQRPVLLIDERGVAADDVDELVGLLGDGGGGVERAVDDLGYGEREGVALFAAMKFSSSICLALSSFFLSMARSSALKALISLYSSV